VRHCAKNANDLQVQSDFRYCTSIVRPDRAEESIGTPGSDFDGRIASAVFTLATLFAAVSCSVTKD
jgi:hypothetical protein